MSESRRTLKWVNIRVFDIYIIQRGPLRQEAKQEIGQMRYTPAPMLCNVMNNLIVIKHFVQLYLEFNITAVMIAVIR